MPTKAFSYNGYTIPYTDTGTGKIIVLLHGFAETSHVWKNQINFLANQYRVIALELPNAKAENTGHPQGLPLRIDAMADAAAALIQSVTAEPVILLGHSMGGYLTLAVAEKYPHLLKAFWPYPFHSFC